jgi:hypothetical protein
LIWALIRIVTSAMLLVGFIMIIVAGIMMTIDGASSGNFKKGKDLILKIWTIIALVGLSGVILNLINPTFFR